MAARGPQNGQQDLERGVPQVFERSRQLSQNKYFDLWSHFMRKGCGGEEKWRKVEKRMVKMLVY